MVGLGWFLGKLFEDKAVAFLKQNGFKIIERNFRVHNIGELDIIAQKAKEVYFVEVRHRGKGSFATGLESVDKRKMRKIVKTAICYIKQKRLKTNKTFHFTVISIDDNDRVDVIWDAFSLDDIGYYSSL